MIIECMSVQYYRSTVYIQNTTTLYDVYVKYAASLFVYALTETQNPNVRYM